MHVSLLMSSLLTALAATPAAGEDLRAAHALDGRIVDVSGAPVPGASVTVETAGRALSARSGPDGSFAVADIHSPQAVLVVAAPGFSPERLYLDLGERRQPLSIVLRPAALSETVSVTATRGEARLAAPQSVTVLAAAGLLTAPAGALDDALRGTPGFSLFRRSSSRVANPTTQGVTLRGLSSSGASRTLVLVDGVTLNDPFGSWVYWNRVPQAAIERVEVVRGASPDLHGADALGGVVQLFTYAPDRSRLRVLADFGSHETARASLFGSASRNGVTASLGGEWLDTAGVPVVAAAERGPVDTRADSDYRTAFATVGYASEAWRATVKGHAYSEERGNGTALQSNSTAWRQLSGEASGAAGRGAWVFRGSVGSQDYSQSFSAVLPERTAERLTASQVTPTSSWSASGQWSLAWGAHALLAGVEGRGATSTNTETRFTVSGATLDPAVTGGTERIGSAFARTRLGSRRLRVDAGARADVWTSRPQQATAGSRSVALFSPRVAFTARAGRGIAVMASAYRAYRTPTLNELHRDFRVGSVLTTANALLGPERLTGLEAGLLADWPRAAVRLTGFLNEVDAAITSVTLTTTPTLILRERRNAGRVRSAGLELEADLRPHPRLVLTAAVAVTDARFRGTAAGPALEGKRVPQMPRYQAGLGASLTGPDGLTVTAQARVSGRQFDDDLNQFELAGFAVVDAAATRPLSRHVSVLAAVENLFDSEYDVGRTPVRTVGWPRTLRASVRLFWP